MKLNHQFRLFLFIFVVCNMAHFQVTAQRKECGAKPLNVSEFTKRENKALTHSAEIQIPVIVHVLYRTPDENITDEAIHELLNELQSDFLAQNIDISKVPTDFKGDVGSPGIKFYPCPDSIYPQSIVRVATNRKLYKYNERIIFKDSPIIKGDRVLNIYVCNLNTNGSTPDEAKHHAVEINYTRAEAGLRTLTHEVGHWCDLYHIFEGGCSNSDRVKDTPGQKKHPHTCPTHPCIECGHRVMYMNFMDYSCDRIFFTTDQVSRMRNFLTTYINLNL